MDGPVCANNHPPNTRVANIEIIEPDPEDCTPSLPPEGNVKIRNYRMLSENLRAYTPTGDIHTSPTKGKLVAKFDVVSVLSPPRARILELLRPEDEGRDALEAIVRPASRRGLARPLDDDTKRFLQRALLSPSPQGLSAGNTPEPYRQDTIESERPDSRIQDTPVSERAESRRQYTPESDNKRFLQRAFLSPSPQGLSTGNSPEPYRQDTPGSERAESRRQYSPETERIESRNESNENNNSIQSERSLADELREAEEEERSGRCVKRDLLSEWRRGVEGEACERERLGKLALAVEEDEVCGEVEGLTAAARRLDALLAESRGLHEELASLHEDIQACSARACRCTAAARALQAESRALRYLDDVVALLKGEVHAAKRARAWPFAFGARDPARSYVV